MPAPIFQVDAFAVRPFTGNPACVCLLPGEADGEWMQNVARELMVPATAFVATGTRPLKLRWFTPTTELDLCGHATLASAHVLWEEGVEHPDDPLVFETRSGGLTAERSAGAIELDFPSEPPRDGSAYPHLRAALGAPSIRYIGRNRMDLLVELEREEHVRSLRPDMAALARIPARGVIVTAAGEGEYDFVSRFFAPAIGVPEDSVTGSAHCCLGPFWADRLGRSSLRAYQASARGGDIAVRVHGTRTRLGGRAMTVMKGNLLL